MCVLWSSFFVVCDHNPGPRLSRICARYSKIEDVNECLVFQRRNLMLSAVESQYDFTSGLCVCICIGMYRVLLM